MEEYPAGVDHGRCSALLTGMEGRHQAEEEADGKDEDAQGDGFVAPIDEEKCQREEEAEQGLGLVGVDRQAMVGGVEHFGGVDVVEWAGCGGGGGGAL